MKLGIDVVSDLQQAFGAPVNLERPGSSPQRYTQ